MKTPITAMMWNCWRISRRWHLTTSLIISSLSITVFSIAPEPLIAGEGVFIIAFSLTCLLSFSAVSLGNNEGFPFRYQFRLPISTPALVTASILSMCIIYASILLIPLIIFRLIFDIPFPLLAPGLAIALLVTSILTATWSTTGTTTRGFAIAGVFVGIPLIMQAFNPFKVTSRRTAEDELFNPMLMSFSSTEYLISILLIAGLIGISILSIKKQRCGETLSLLELIRDGLNTVRGKESPSKMGVESSRKFIEKLSDLFTLPCPVNSPLQAEIWFEAKRFGAPVVLLGSMLALLTPFLIALEQYLNLELLSHIIYTNSTLLFFVGIGMSIFNRRRASSGYMNAFEASRGMSTVQLLSIQIGVLSISVLLSMGLSLLSLWLSWNFIDGENNAYILMVQNHLAQYASFSPFALFCLGITLLINYLMLIMAFSCLHSCSVFWGKLFNGIILFVVAYAFNYAMRIIFNSVPLDSLITHLWSVAVIIFAVLALCLWGIWRKQVLSKRSALIMLATWAVFVFCSVVVLENQGDHLLDMASELLVFNLATLSLPLACFLLMTWCYDKLRHG